jgi:hypothetical protein
LFNFSILKIKGKMNDIKALYGPIKQKKVKPKVGSKPLGK